MKTYDETKYPYKAKLALEYMIDSLNESQAEVSKYKDLAEQNWKIQPFKAYLRDTFEFVWTSKGTGRYGWDEEVKGTFSRTYWGDKLEMKTSPEQIAAMKIQDAATHEENKQIAAQNAICFKKLVDLLTAMGIKQTVTDTKSRKMFKPQIKANFVREIEAQCKTCAPSSPDWDSIERAIEERAEKKRVVELEVERKKEEEEKKKKQSKLFIDLIKKYNFDFPSGLPNADDLLEAILRKNKYLYLAHYLSLNRGDWNDGYSYAETGLNGFAVKTDEDKEIYADVYSYFEDFSDGRVFRDSVWNYTRLFSMVPTDLMDDYNKVNEYVERY